MSGPTKPLLALATAALLLGSLSGCFLLPHAPGPAPSPSASTHRSTVDGVAVAETGDCWQTSYADLAAWASWEGDGRVDCEERHQSYTYLADDLDRPVAEGYDEEGFMTNELALATSEQCRTALEDEFDWTEQQQRLGFFFFVPNEVDWIDGDRAIRCDMGIKAFDSDFYNPDLEDLPDVIDLKDDLASNGVAFQLCLTGDGFGPLEGTEAIIADCTDDGYLWRWGGLLDYPAAPGDAYPAGDTLFNYALDECPTLGIAQEETVYPYTPSPDAWADGDHSIECWFSTVEQPTSAV